MQACSSLSIIIRARTHVLSLGASINVQALNCLSSMIENMAISKSPQMLGRLASAGFSLLIWYAFAAGATILTRRLTVVGSLNISIVQFGIGSLWGLTAVLISETQQKVGLASESVSTRTKQAVRRALLSLPKAKCMTLCYAVGHIATDYSFVVMQPSLSHTIKASEPLFTVLFSLALRRPRPSPTQFLSLILIVTGVVVVSVSEFDSPASGIAACIISNLCFSMRNVKPLFGFRSSGLGARV